MKSLFRFWLFAFTLLLASNAQAASITWTDWTGATTSPTAGTASGTMGAIGVSYSGEVQQLVDNYPSWGPAGTFNGGTVDNAPPSSGGIIRIFGGGDVLNTISFSTPVVDPVMAIWSLGRPSFEASFVFSEGLTFSIEAGGPNNEFGGSAITSVGQTVLGKEGNGIVQFLGTYSSLSWTNPTSENWYGFTAGVVGPADLGEIPAPATLLLALTAFGILPAMRRRRLQ